MLHSLRTGIARLSFLRIARSMELVCDRSDLYYHPLVVVESLHCGPHCCVPAGLPL